MNCKQTLLTALAVLPFAFAPAGIATSCAPLNASADPDPAVVAEYTAYSEEYEIAERDLIAARAAAAANPSPENLAALAAAEERFAAAEQAFIAWERDYYRSKNGPVATAVASLLGAFHPGLQPVALGVGALALNAGAAFASPRGRKHLWRSIKRWNPWTEVDGKKGVAPIQSLVDVARGLGWIHSSEASQRAADADEQLRRSPKAPDAGPAS